MRWNSPHKPFLLPREIGSRRTLVVSRSTLAPHATVTADTPRAEEVASSRAGSVAKPGFSLLLTIKPLITRFRGIRPTFDGVGSPASVAGCCQTNPPGRVPLPMGLSLSTRRL